jgi:hypothetical protein
MTPLAHITVWSVGVAGPRCVPRSGQRYVIVPQRDRDANAWAVWRETDTGHADLVDGHVSVELNAGDSHSPDVAAEQADVLRLGGPECAERVEPVARAAALVDRALARYPGCLVAIAPEAAGGCVAGTRDGTRVVAVPVAGSLPRLMTGHERAGFASFLHSQLVLGQCWTAESGPVVHAIQSDQSAHAPLWVRVDSRSR